MALLRSFSCHLKYKKERKKHGGGALLDERPDLVLGLEVWSYFNPNKLSNFSRAPLVGYVEGDSWLSVSNCLIGDFTTNHNNKYF